MDGLRELLKALEVKDKLAAAGYRPAPERIAPDDWVWWVTRKGVERPLSRVEVSDRGWYLVRYRDEHGEWSGAWVRFEAVTGHVPDEMVRGEREAVRKERPVPSKGTQKRARRTTA